MESAVDGLFWGDYREGAVVARVQISGSLVLKTRIEKKRRLRIESLKWPWGKGPLMILTPAGVKSVAVEAY